MIDTPARRFARSASVGLGAVALVAASAAAPFGAAVAADPGDEVNLLSFNDFHGALDAGNAFACTAVTARSQHENSALLSAGDNVGGSAFASAVANDEPTLDLLGALGVDASAIGNHEYDQGQEDLNGRISDSADFPYLAANVVEKETGEHAQQPYSMVDAGEVKVAVVGAVTTKTVSKVSPAKIEGLQFLDPVDSVNDAIEELDASGEEYDVLVASYHEGASGNGAPGEAPANSDPVFDKIVSETSPEVDAIFNGDSHQTYAYNAPVPGQDGEVRPIMQTGANGANLGSVILALGEDGDWDVTEGGTELIPTENADLASCEGDETYQEASTIVADALENAEEEGSEPVGTIADDITTSWGSSVAEYDGEGVRRTQDPVSDQANTKGDDRSRHSAAGDMLADSMKWWLEDEGAGSEHEVIGWMNPGGIRAELWYDAAGEDGDGVVTYAEANSMVPFGNTLNSGEVTGAQFIQMLEEQWQRDEQGAPTSEFLAFSVSNNVEYTFDSTGEMDEHITEVRIGGEPIDPEGTYTIVTASFLFEGGDNMWTLSEAADVRDSGVLDRDAFIEYLEANSDLAPDYSQRQLDLQVLDGGEDDAVAGTDRDAVLRIGGLDSLSLGAPQIEKVVVDAGEYGTFEAPYEMVEDQGRAYADVTLTDGLCVPEGTDVPLSITAIPDAGTEITADLPSFTGSSGEMPDGCSGDEGATPPPSDGGDEADVSQGEDGQGGDGQGDGSEGEDPQGGADQGDDAQGGGSQGDIAQEDDTEAPPVDDGTGEPTAGDTPSDLARTGADVAPYVVAIGFLALAGIGALGLRHRLTHR
ncbi:5'-nucleotidase C-terminal domain-containing protein [Brachybacterium sacelli]|uniref:5'-nucleotidase n=1 Tax=Brachybacterium sacelli TaxID=173364 RepID=A0ABS4WVZ5_9MICO|nr:5'-nucleotidase C-terminal domain-containing protein [Brachybacterium sacelli]MBP2380138.1 5'-nucleotidase [Brachybacterium sacelli]